MQSKSSWRTSATTCCRSSRRSRPGGPSVACRSTLVRRRSSLIINSTPRIGSLTSSALRFLQAGQKKSQTVPPHFVALALFPPSQPTILLPADLSSPPPRLARLFASPSTLVCAPSNPTLAKRLQDIYDSDTFELEGKTYTCFPKDGQTDHLPVEKKKQSNGGKK